MRKLTSSEKRRNYYKWIFSDGHSNFAYFDYSKYIGEMPSEELPMIQNIEMCRTGYHFTDSKNLLEWLSSSDCKLYKIVPKGDVYSSDTKFVSQSFKFSQYIGNFNAVAKQQFKAMMINENIDKLEKFLYKYCNTNKIDFIPVEALMKILKSMNLHTMVLSPQFSVCNFSLDLSEILNKYKSEHYYIYNYLNDEFNSIENRNKYTDRHKIIWNNLMCSIKCILCYISKSHLSYTSYYFKDDLTIGEKNIKTYVSKKIIDFLKLTQF